MGACNVHWVRAALRLFSCDEESLLSSRFPCRKRRRALEGSLPGRLPLGTLPPEVLHAVVLCFRRGDLQSLAICAAVSRAFLGLCEPLLRRFFVCRGCGCHLLHPKQLATRMASSGVFEDGPALVLSHSGNLPEIAEVPCDAGVTEPPRQREVRRLIKAYYCKALPQTRDFWESKLHMAKVCHTHRLHCNSCSLYLGSKLQLLLDAETLLLTSICGPYLQEMDKDGPCAADGIGLILHCSGARRQKGRIPSVCGQALCSADSVLSRHHCWRPPGSSVEGAWYINEFLPGSVDVGQPSPRNLAQGSMETADVTCRACGGYVGWKFAKDLEGSRNVHQVGRFGLCCSSIQELTEARRGQKVRGEGEESYDSDSATSAATSSLSERPPPDPDDADEVPSQSNAAAETPTEQPSTRL